MLVVDIAGIIVLFPLLFMLRFERTPEIFAPELWLILLSIIVTMFLSGTYFKNRSKKIPPIPVMTFFKSLMALFPCMLIVYLLGPEKFNTYFGRGILPLGMILFGMWATLNRYIFNRIYYWHEQKSDLLYMGFSASGQQFLKELQNNSEMRRVFVASPNSFDSPIPELTQRCDDDASVFSKRLWREVILDPEYHASTVVTKELVRLRLSGMPVGSLSDYYERHWFKIPVHQIEDDWFLHSSGFAMVGSAFSLRLKRLIDIVLALMLLLLTLPVVLVAALMVVKSSAGPALFMQTRVGLNGSNFKIYKLRTMRADAEKKGAQWAQENDPRITSIGRFLRASRIDELPQCWNVLKGDMSFIGPRPERPEFTQKLAKTIPYYELRHLVKPGLSGWAQVMYPYGASAEDALKKLEYDLFYIKNQSFLLDLNIMMRTIMVVFKRQGR